MKITLICILAALVAVHGRRLAKNDPSCKASSPCGECEPSKDCDSQQECKKGLLCADNWKSTLTSLGLNKRKAYCTVPAAGNTELCFDPCKIKGFPKVDGITCNDPSCQKSNPCGECQPNFDCDINEHCAEGLLCADLYEDTLKSLGWDRRKAYCDVDAAWNSELCFDPCKIEGFPLPVGFECDGQGEVCSEWECGDPLIICNDDPNCFCDIDVDGNQACTAIEFCNTGTCSSSSDCPEGQACLTSCCSDGLPTCQSLCGSGGGLPEQIATEEDQSCQPTTVTVCD